MASSKASTGCILHPAIMINCAFARVAFRELSQEPEQRATHFKELFCEYPGFQLPDSYFTECNGKRNPTQFDKDLARVNKAFSSKWHPPAARLQYERQFATSKWKSLSSDQKQKHSLSQCEACFVQFLQYQNLFPLKPLFEPESLLHIDTCDIEWLKEKEFVKLALQELDKICSENFNKSFKDGLLKHAKAGIQKRPTPTEKSAKSELFYASVVTQSAIFRYSSQNSACLRWVNWQLPTQKAFTIIWETACTKMAKIPFSKFWKGRMG